MTTDTPPKRIVIVGGGISSIITAFELTATPELRAKHQVTICQLGWRLGGKLASGANPAMDDRNEEHGLHVWFGFYDNAFNDITKCYDELQTVCPNFRYKSCFDAFKPNDWTPIGHHTDDGGYGWWPFRWPTRNGTPGQYDEHVPHPKPLKVIGQILAWLRDYLESEIGLHKFVTGELESLCEDVVHLITSTTSSLPETLVDGCNAAGLDHAIRWLEVLEDAGPSEKQPRANHLASFLTKLKTHFLSILLRLGYAHPDDHPVISAVELVLTNIIGLLNPKYGWLTDYNLNRIDYLDYRAFLLENGGNAGVVNGSSYIRALYDIPFAYENGDINKPNFAAGAALRWAIRSAFTYRGHAMYEPQCGFGEAVIGPYYEVLKARGVQFKFFHKLTATGISGDGQLVESLSFDIQAETRDGADYDPVTFSDGLYHWPVEPHWDQLKDGGLMKTHGADFESHWNPVKPVGQIVLQNGKDFDHVVIALAGAVWKTLNNVDSSPVKGMIDVRPDFASAANSLGIVATAGVQFWMNKDSKSLGWDKAPATVGGPEPLDVWADMSQVIESEGWPASGPKPQSLHYLCGPINTTMFASPSTDPTVPKQADETVVQLTQAWLDKYGTTNWPGAADSNGGFDYGVLFDTSNAGGLPRLLNQYLRANVSPTECCGASFAGTTQHRTSADDLMFLNASVVGADTNTGINVTCVEGATISARKASRRICGSPQVIPGENFMAGAFPPPPAA